MDLRTLRLQKREDTLYPAIGHSATAAGDPVRIELTRLGPSVQVAFTVQGEDLPRRLRLVRDVPKTKQDLRGLLESLSVEAEEI